MRLQWSLISWCEEDVRKLCQAERKFDWKLGLEKFKINILTMVK